MWAILSGNVLSYCFIVISLLVKYWIKLLRYFSFGLYRLKSYRVRFEQEKNALFASN